MIQHECSKLFEETSHYSKLIKQQVSFLEFNLLLYRIKLSIKPVLSSKLSKLNYKLFNLWKKHKLRSPDCIVNLSDKTLSVEETNALYLGLKHHILQKEIDILKLKSTIKNYISRILKAHKVSPDDELKDELKFATLAFLRASTNRCHSRSNQALHNCFSKLSTNQTIKICQFDKDNGVAVWNSDCYFKKLDSIVNDLTKFKEINFNLDNNLLEECKSARWIKRANSIKYYLTTYIKPIVDPVTYLNLLPSGSVPGRLYGKPKIHKTGCPLRPVTSMINTPKHNLAKWLDSLIKPYIPDRYSLPSTLSFIEKIKELKPTNNAKLVSFDVTGLFTNVLADPCN